MQRPHLQAAGPSRGRSASQHLPQEQADPACSRSSGPAAQAQHPRLHGRGQRRAEAGKGSAAVQSPTGNCSRAERRPGRPKTNPLSRDEQLRINKRNQLKRDKVRGLKRVELKLNAEAVEALNELAESRNMSRSELIEEMLMQQLAALRSQGIV